MKTFAQVDENNTVINVAVFGDEQTPTNLGWLGWIETTDNLKEQASVGDTTFQRRLVTLTVFSIRQVHIRDGC